MNSNSDDVYTVTQAAEKCKCSQHDIQQLIQNNQLPDAQKYGNQLLIPVKSINALMEKVAQ